MINCDTGGFFVAPMGDELAAGNRLDNLDIPEQAPERLLAEQEIGALAHLAVDSKALQLLLAIAVSPAPVSLGAVGHTPKRQ